MLEPEPVHEIDLGPDRPVGPGRRLPHLLDDELGRAHKVGVLDHVEGALGMDQDLDPGVLGARLVDLPAGELGVHRAETAPQDEARLGPEAADVLALQVLGPVVPFGHGVERHAHRVTGVAAEVLVREEEHPGLPGPGPLEHAPGVGGGAHHAAARPAERLERRRRVHVGDGDERVAVHPGQALPGLLDILHDRHVGHRAAGLEVGKDHGLPRLPEDIGRLGHEVHAAEHDELGLGAARRKLGELEGVAAEVSELDHALALVMVPEDHGAAPQRPLGGPGALADLCGGERGVLRERPGGAGGR